MISQWTIRNTCDTAGSLQQMFLASHIRITLFVESATTAELGAGLRWELSGDRAESLHHQPPGSHTRELRLPRAQSREATSGCSRWYSIGYVMYGLRLGLVRVLW